MTKKQALTIRDEIFPVHHVASGDRRVAARHMIEALDRAGAFPSEEGAAEINEVATLILSAPELEDETSEFSRGYWVGLALRLATACRAAGLVKP